MKNRKYLSTDQMRMLSQLLVACRKSGVRVKVLSLVNNKLYCYHILEVIEANCNMDILLMAIQTVKELDNLELSVPTDLKDASAITRYFHEKREKNKALLNKHRSSHKHNEHAAIGA